MDLTALLDELRVNLLTDDAQLASGPSDQLWSDDALIRYINDAQNRFARKTLILRDDRTPDVVEVALVTSTTTYDLHPSVLSVASARFNTDTVDLGRVGRSIISQLYNEPTDVFDLSSVGTYSPGRPRAIATDETLSADAPGSLVLRVWPPPSSTEDGLLVYLRVARKPLELFSLDKMDKECEIPDDYQLDMLEWAAYRALRNSDIDGHAEDAEKHKTRFEESIKECLKEVRQKLFAPIAWQFGRGGWVWGA